MTMSWLQYYQAVKRGDLQTIKKATDKDFRIGLTMDKCAIELAALHGHTNILEHFLARTDRTGDFDLLVEVLKETLHGGHVELARKVMAFLGPIAEVRDAGRWKKVSIAIVLAAINGRNIECLKLAWDYSTEKQAVHYAMEAFTTGSPEILKFVYEFGLRNPSLSMHEKCEIYAGRALPIGFFFLGMGDLKNAEKYIDYVPLGHDGTFGDSSDSSDEDGESNDVDGRNYKMTSAERRNLDSFTVLDACGYFGQVEYLKRQIEKRRKARNFRESELRAELQSVIMFALRKNHSNIVEYLVENDLVDAKPPYEYDGFEMNEAFEYLEEKTRDYKVNDDHNHENPNWHRFRVLPSFWVGTGPEYNFDHKENRKRLWLSTRFPEDRNATRLTKIEEFYEYLMDAYNNNGPKDESLFTCAVSEQNVDAALVLLRRIGVGHQDCHRSSLPGGRTRITHPHLRKAMSAPHVKDGIITSPVIAELLVDAVNAGACTCGKVNLLHLFLQVPADGDQIVPPIKDQIRFATASMMGISNDLKPNRNCENPKPELRLDLLVKRSEIVLRILLDNGFPKPTSKRILELIMDLYRVPDSCISAMGGKILAVLNCCKDEFDSEDVDLSETISAIRKSKWPKRGEFLTALKKALNLQRGRNRNNNNTNN